MVRGLVFAALVVAIAIGLLLPAGAAKTQKPVMVSQIPTMSVN